MVRLLAAARATSGGVLTLLLVMLLGMAIPLAVGDRVLGFAVGLYLGAAARDASRRRQALTMLIGAAAAFATTALTSALGAAPWLSAVAMILLIFLAVYGAARGPRWASVGTVALIGYLLGLVTHPGFGELPARLLVIAIGAADAALVRFVLLPERPRAELMRLRRALRREAAQALTQIETALREGAWRPDTLRRLDADVERVRDATMMALARLAPADDAAATLGLRLVELELITERTARIAARDLGLPEERPSILALLSGLRGALQAAHMPSAGTWTERFRSPLGRILVGFARLLEEPLHPVSASPPTSADLPAATSGLRPAAQASLASTLAVVGGNLVYPNRWYWAVFAAYVLFQGTRSRAESVVKALQLMAGTVAGVIVGVLVATLLGAQPLLSMLAIVAAVFLAFDASVTAYGVMIFWITILIGLMFGLLGYFAPGLLLVRLEESAVGAACGIAVACLVLARPTTDVTRAATGALLSAIGELTAAAAASLMAGAPDTAVLGLIIRVDQRLQDLHGAAQPELHGLAGLGQCALRRRLLLLGACGFWARELGHVSLEISGTLDPDVLPTTREASSRIAGTIKDLDRNWDLDRNRQVRAEDAQDGGADPLATLPQGLGADDPSHHAARLLLRIEAALGRLTPNAVTAVAG